MLLAVNLLVVRVDGKSSVMISNISVLTFVIFF
jgi:hypothetical protein